MKNHLVTGWILFLLGTTLLLLQMLPGDCWPENPRRLAASSLPSYPMVTGVDVEWLMWHEWQAHRAATQLVVLGR
ncbi:hypothetical protein [Aeromonas sp. MdU4]|uniref:hypothetical protein n=1 Tax=Aeromonas sp. MdU4 TaxID=3342819 RepID=UPI0035B9A01A